ncbi:hypothetical protein M0R72_19605 [Candidatus Pacearchaeota archaeon]|jgi:hypothetical protein|nr:hypothetical protein [Candidatus Pacearchaeota archaeon]
MAICEKCRAVLVDGVCVPCKERAEEDARHLAANAHFPKEWHVCLHPIKGKRTGQRNYNVWLKQGAYVHEDRSVRYSWHSRPTEDPLRRTYSDQKWECSCGQPDCAHIDIVKAWLKDERAKDRAERAANDIKCGRGPRAPPEPDNEPEPASIHIDEAIAKMRGIPYVPAQPPADPRNCEYWQEESWAQWCGFRDGACPHRYNMVCCRLRNGPGVYRKVLV